MKVFISWSGERSRSLGTALNNWLPSVLQYTQPWLSERDIAAGDRWGTEIGKKLEECNFGIICLTKDNLEAPWILFEAGAISKIVSASSVCPFLLDLDHTDISGPLSQYQAKKADKSGTLDLLKAINAKHREPLELIRLNQIFDGMWSSLQSQISSIPKQKGDAKPARAQVEVLEDLVMGIRGLDSRVANLESLMIPEKGSWSTDLSVMVAIQYDPTWQGSRTLTRKKFLYRPGGNVVAIVSKFAGLDISDFGSNWFLKDEELHALSQEELSQLDKYFGDKSARLIISDSDLPF